VCDLRFTRSRAIESDILRLRDVSSNRLRYLSSLSQRQLLSKDSISKGTRRRLAERYDAFADTRRSGAPGTLQRRIIIRLGIFVHSTYLFPLFPSRLKNTNDRTKKEKKSELRSHR